MTSLPPGVSLHCIICFEEFSTRERPPVVLPCGHTYVCIVCAKRLKRCMECREPLFWTPPKPAALQHTTRSPAPHSRYARGRYSPAPQTPPHPSVVPVKEEPLPLPKNTVLLEMIESAERQQQLMARRYRPNGGLEALIDEDTEESTRSEPDGFDPILSGMTTFTSRCGTYAVREPAGLAVLPFDPNRKHHIQDEKKEHQNLSEEEKKAEESKEPFTIQEGQMVQVVGVDEGVYQLARGAGFVVALERQLVKVSGPLEKSCQYEGMLKSVEEKQHELQGELENVNLLARSLQEKIVLQRDLPEDHPVISLPREREGEHENDESAAPTPSTPPAITKLGESSPVGLHMTQSTDSTEVELSYPRTPAQDMQHPHDLPPSPQSCPIPNSRLSQPFIDAESAGLPRYRLNVDDDPSGAMLLGFGCGTSLFGERLLDYDDTASNFMSLSFDENMQDENDAQSHSGQSRGAATISSLAARSVPGVEFQAQMESSLRSGSFDGINFRTGMSGHTGLSKAGKKKPASPMARRQIRFMSAHRGIASVPPRGNLKQRTTEDEHG